MSVIGEVVGIVDLQACVAGVISAYKDGGAIIEKIKVKRAHKRAPPPPRLLEESIDQAPEEIEKEKKRGIQRFGKAFEDGDHIAVIALQHITIQLQGSLLEKLRNAAFDDEQVTDFTFLVDAADLGRDRTIATLLELRQRLLQAAPITELEALSINDGNRKISVATDERPTDQPKGAVCPPPQPQTGHRRTWTREYSNSRDASGDEDSAQPGADDHHAHDRKRHSSIRDFFHRHHRSYSGSQNQIPKAVEQVQASNTSPDKMTPFVPPPTCNASEQSLVNEPRPSYQGLEQRYQYAFDGDDDPIRIWGEREGSQERRDTVSSFQIPPDRPTQPSRMRTDTTSSSVSTIRPNHTSSSIPTPTPDNNYLGFCKSAWRLQHGDRAKALTKCKEFNDGWSQSNVYFLGCSSNKCAFAGHIALDKIWDKVWTYETKGLKFRWPFLAKSHVSQAKVKDHQYAFQCMFCVFMSQKTPVFHGTDTFMDHIADVHRGQDIGEVVLYKTKCIKDRVAPDTEEFDINLMPLSNEELARRRQSEAVLSDELLNNTKNSSDGKDSVVEPNEPWNEGLSNFHWEGDMD
ncbi:SH3 domain-containing protein [Teratosphaeria destructans]|uniref:SH3 domain-containing protein n=1 Tax=Teratosphaeria destructans TaxID=418781 RepID=A0A9W7W127_9PEZI|nr:SH3 domain-containing protein [Teratosphaeria destructans]